MSDTDLRRLILEIGTGNDLYGMDYTKAAIRAVQDALHHSSLVLFKSLELDPNAMAVTVTIAVQEPDKVDVARVKEQIPYGSVTVNPVLGGLNVEDPDNGITTVMAMAGVEAFYPLRDGQFTLATG